MRLYRGQVSAIAQDVARTLTESGDLEVEPGNIVEVERDVESVLNEYIRQDRELSTEARDLQASRGGSFGRIKSRLAKRKGLDIHEDPMGYVIAQIIDIFYHSPFVEEVFAGDRDLRIKLKPIIEKYTQIEEQLDSEVRDKIKNLQEGSREWEIEYEKAMARVKRTKKLD